MHKEDVDFNTDSGGQVTVRHEIKTSIFKEFLQVEVSQK